MQPRIASLLPSATEIVCALGRRESLVGRSHECDHPPEVRELPVLTETKLGEVSGSTAIGSRVRQILSEGLSIYRVDGERLRRLQPDVIITQTQCEVCAASLEDVEAAVRSWIADDVEIVALNPLSLSDIWADFESVAAAVGAADRGEALVERCLERVGAISKLATSAATRPTVATIEWLDPPMAGGNWMPELVELAGGENVFGEAGAHSPLLEWESLLERNPDVILIVPCGFQIHETRRDLGVIAGRPGWQELRAVREDRAFVMDGNAYFNRPGPRIVDSLEILAEVLHPEIVPPRHRGVAYERLQIVGDNR